MSRFQKWLPLIWALSGCVAVAYAQSDATIFGLKVWQFAGMIGAMALAGERQIAQQGESRREVKSDTVILQNEVLDKKQDQAMRGVIVSTEKIPPAAQAVVNEVKAKTE